MPRFPPNLSFKTVYFQPDLFLTLRPAPPTMQPESSDGFASVGTILPKEGAALLPGGSFRLMAPENRFGGLPPNSSPLTRLSTHIASTPFAIQAGFFQSDCARASGDSTRRQRMVCAGQWSGGDRWISHGSVGSGAG